VWIVPHVHLLAWLCAQHNKTVPFERLARFAERL
jgi:arylamine N-acetyltransferase